jgi:AcrR family transcriptional regulator
MSDVSTSYEETGRSSQKQRTRTALLTAARQLIATSGGAPTVAEAATAAGISRTTAYRYFPSQEALLIAAHPEVDTSSMLDATTSDEADDAVDRVESVVRRFLAIIVDSELQQRTMLRLSLTPGVERSGLPLRQGRAIGWVSEALAPLADRFDADDLRRLAIAIRAVSGIESLVWLTDVAGLDTRQAVEQMVWSARALVRQAETEGLALHA